jgi:hypothetical protein
MPHCHAVIFHYYAIDMLSFSLSCFHFAIFRHAMAVFHIIDTPLLRPPLRYIAAATMPPFGFRCRFSYQADYCRFFAIR